MKIRVLLILCLFIIPISYTSEILVQNYKVKDSYIIFADEIIKITEENSVIYMYGLDKTIIPHRRVGLINNSIMENKEFSIELKKIRIPKYIYLKYTDINEEELLEYLEENNIIVIPIKKIIGNELYKVD